MSFFGFDLINYEWLRKKDKKKLGNIVKMLSAAYYMDIHTSSRLVEGIIF
jgi:uncharacterized membrane protein YczE